LEINNERVVLSVAIFLAFLGSRGAYLWMTSERCQARKANLIQATTNLRNDQSHGDALILRAIDDEASLALSFGTIANLFSAQLMSISTLLLLVLVLGDSAASSLMSGYRISDTQFFAIYPIMVLAVLTLILTSLLAFVSRGVFGRELIYQPPGTQMNVQSVPDFIRSAEIRTLLRGDRSVFFALRHGIHSHPLVGEVVADWIGADALPRK
jgi:hypothetical protein